MNALSPDVQLVSSGMDESPHDDTYNMSIESRAPRHQ